MFTTALFIMEKQLTFLSCRGEDSYPQNRRLMELSLAIFLEKIISCAL